MMNTRSGPPGLAASHRLDHAAPGVAVAEARFALAVVASLHAQSQALPHDVSERLRFAREQAVARARSRALQPVVSAAVSVDRSGAATASGLGRPGWRWRFASAVPLLALVVGLVFAQWHRDDEQAQITADIDAALLADALPTSAYTDPGFAEFIRTSSH